MKQFAKILGVILLFTLIMGGCRDKTDKRIQVIEIDGIPHIMNPEEPLKGTVRLDLEKIREIDPYESEEVGLKIFFSARDKDGSLLLYDPNTAETQRYGSQGEYLGLLTRVGQGPGEFPKFQGLKVFFMNDRIWGTSLFKIAWFDKQGSFVDEMKFPPGAFHSIENLVDEHRYIARKLGRADEGNIRSVVLVDFSGAERREEVEFFKAQEEWMIRDQNTQRGFSDSWATPSIHFAYDRQSQRVAAGLNTEYSITVKDIAGNTIHILERSVERVKLSIDDKRKMIGVESENEIKGGPENDFKKWQLSVYPDSLVFFKEILILPRGHLAVLRIAGAPQARDRCL